MTKYPAIIVALLIVVLSGCTGESSEHGGPYIIESVGSDQANEYPIVFEAYAVEQQYSRGYYDITVSIYGENDVLPVGAGSVEIGSVECHMGTIELAPGPKSDHGITFCFELTQLALNHSAFLFLCENPRGSSEKERPVGFAILLREVEIVEWQD